MADTPAVVDGARGNDTWLLHIVEMKFLDGTVRVWSGYPDLEFEGHTWTGLGAMLGITAAQGTIGKPGALFTLSLSSVHPTVRARFREKIGLRPTTVRFVKSLDKGKTWTALPLKKFGYTSNLRTQGGLVMVDIVHPYQIVFRRRARKWSNEDQQRIFPSDTGLAQMRTVATGTNIRFPYLKQQSDK